jgi:DNA polymerase-3 subunit beta
VIEVSAKDLVAGLNLVGDAIGRKPLTTIAAHVLIEPATDSTVRLSGMGDKLKGTAQVDAKFTDFEPFALEHKRLLSVVGAFKAGAKIKVKPEGPKVQVRSGRSKYNLNALPGLDFPKRRELPKKVPVQIDAHAVAQLVATCSHCMNDEDRPQFAGGYLVVAVDSVTMFATDGRRVVQHKISSPQSAPMEGFFTKEALAALVRTTRTMDDDECLNVVAQANAIFFWNTRTGFEAGLPHMKARVPYESFFLPEPELAALSVDRVQLTEALQRLQKISDDQTIKLSNPKDGELHVESQDQSGASGIEVIPISEMGEVPATRLNSIHVLEALRVCTQHESSVLRFWKDRITISPYASDGDEQVEVIYAQAVGNG